jgi:protein involved in ribonucleotide reduction
VDGIALQSSRLFILLEVEMTVLIAYTILQGTTKEQLEALVREAIGKGWQPIGGVAVSGNVFYQAMAGH